MGVEIKEGEVSETDFDDMEEFVQDYLAASVENEADGGRMRWYPWHSAEYRFNHIQNVVALGDKIARQEGADRNVVRVAALFHDVAKLEAEQDVHAEAGASVAQQYLETRGQVPDSFIKEVCRGVERHSYQGSLDDVSMETRCLMEADLLDKIGANGTALMLLRMGYESRSHMDTAKMVTRVLERGQKHASRLESDTAQSIAHQRLKRVRWFREWVEEEIVEIDRDGPFDDI